VLRRVIICPLMQFSSQFAEDHFMSLTDIESGFQSLGQRQTRTRSALAFHGRLWSSYLFVYVMHKHTYTNRQPSGLILSLCYVSVLRDDISQYTLQIDHQFIIVIVV